MASITSNELAVIIVHVGYKDYLRCNLEITGKNNKIYLIGDNSVKHLGHLPNVTFINIDKYKNNKKIIEYKKYYTNYSSYQFEWIWHAGPLRIFIIHEFLKEYNLKNIFNIDSDNILLKNINDYFFSKEVAYCITKNYHEERMGNSIHNGLLTINFCNKFEELYNDIYINKSKLHLIEKKIEYHKDMNGNYINGGICEMTFCYLLQNLKIVDVENVLEHKKINNTDCVFMNNINNGEGPDSKEQYIMKNGIINFVKDKNGINNFIYDKINKKLLDIFNIHFQGTAKKFLNDNLKNHINY